MKKKNNVKQVFKKATAFSLAVIMAFGLSACGNKSNEADNTPAPAQEETPVQPDSSNANADSQADSSSKITFPLAEPVELTIACADLGSASLSANLPVWQEIEKRTNVKINWDVTAAAQYTEVMKLRVTASGANLPDIMLLPNGLKLAELGSEGVILPLEQYIEENGDAILAAYKKFPRVRALTSSEGHVYSINSMNEAAYFSPYGFIIRKDWLDRLNLEVPTTIEEWETVLTAFKEQDANGNGDPSDEVPYSAGGSVWYTTYWGNAWGLHMIQSSGWYPDENGQMQYEYISDNAREWFTWMNKMYESGLIDPEFLTLGDESKMFEKVARNEVGAFTANPSQIPTLEATLRANGVEDAVLIPVVVPKGPHAQSTEVIGDMAVDGYMVTSSCQNPEIAVAFINYLLSDEGAELLNFGIEGETYTKNADGTYTFTDAVLNDPDGKSPKEVLETYGCWIDGPTIKLEAREAALLATYPEDTAQEILQYTDQTKPFAVPGLTLPAETAEESDSISGLNADLKTYIYEMAGRFVVGTADVETEWDTYVQNAKDLSVEKIQAVKQAQYDRFVQEMGDN